MSISIHFPTSDSLVDVLDRVMDKGIVVESWMHISLHGLIPVLNDCSLVLSSAEVYQGYGEDSRKRELLGDLFPYWRKDLWTK
ncbi:MAG TPA: gas vesicle protein GvpJ [Candidatus Angelobacter sp.]|nr:gas vesicle protein GvpJ [Candidatus Angelobacter sp.]